MEHKGYVGRITSVDENRGILHGDVVDLDDVITFQGRTLEELTQAFKDSVEDYLEFCAQRSQDPEVPRSGSLPTGMQRLVDQRLADLEANPEVLMTWNDIKSRVQRER